MSLCTPLELTVADLSGTDGCRCVCGIPGCGSDCRGMFCANAKTLVNANHATMEIYLFILDSSKLFSARSCAGTMAKLALFDEKMALTGWMIADARGWPAGKHAMTHSGPEGAEQHL